MPAGVTADSRPSLSLEAVSRIGCDDCDDARQITPTALALLDNGHIAVLDRFEPFVRVFDQAGAPIVSYGAKGEGPGEMGFSGGNVYFPGTWIVGRPGAGVAVVDEFPPSLQMFSADGVFVARQRLEGLAAAPIAQAFNPSSRAFFRYGFDPGQGGSTITRCILDSQRGYPCVALGTPTDLVASETDPEALARGRGPVELAATPDGGLILADRSSYQMWRLDQSGAVIWKTTRDIERTPKSEVELVAERRNAERFGRAAEVDPLRLRIASRGMQLDGSGRLWVLTERYAEDNSVFDVFSGAGELLSEIEVNAVLRRGQYTAGLMSLRGDLLAAIAQEADGSESIVVYRIVER